ncbi:MAG: ThiF family adenylyltransferase [Chloroflexota bacterium]
MTQVHAFNPDNTLTEIVLVGLGGTGSQWARTICRIVWDLRRRRQHVPTIRFVDPDKVEAKNVGRQMFTQADIGYYKAEVLARRFNLAMGLNIIWHNAPFDTEQHTQGHGTVLCGAVDNHLARLELSKVKGVWIDSGNAASSGQVIIGCSSDKSEVLRSIESGRFSRLPNAALVFPALLEPEPEPVPTPTLDLSCADLMESGEQRLLVNDLMGHVAGEYTFKLLNRLPIYSFLTFVDAEGLAIRSVPITKDDLLAYLN